MTARIFDGAVPSHAAGSTVRRRHAFRLFCTAAMLVLAISNARAGILDAETCRRLKSERDALEGAGLREIMTKGPDWAKTNLTKERMDQIRRFLTLEEDVRFRCPLGKARPELEAAESEAGSTTPLQPGETPTNTGTGTGTGETQATAKVARKPRQPSKPVHADTTEAQGSGGTTATDGDKPTPGRPAAKKKPTGTKEAQAKEGQTKDTPVKDTQAKASDTADGDTASESARKKPR